MMTTTMLLDPREVLAEDVKEALLRHYFGRRKIAISVDKTGADSPMLCVILEDGQKLHLTVADARS